MRPILEDDLQAYVDGALEAERMAEVAAYLKDHPETAARIEAYAGDRARLREGLSPVAEEPVPPELNLARLIEERKTRADRLGSWRAAAAAALFLLVGGASGWSLRDLSLSPRAGIASLAQEAADSYAVYAADAGRPVEIGAREQTELVSWASRRLERPVSVPDLSGAGFRFMGGRLVATPHGPAVLYMFDNGQGMRLIMLMRNMAVDKNAPMAEQAKGPVGAVSWSRDGLGFSLVGPLAPSALHPIANQARRQIDHRV